MRRPCEVIPPDADEQAVERVQKQFEASCLRDKPSMDVWLETKPRSGFMPTTPPALMLFIKQ